MKRWLLLALLAALLAVAGCGSGVRALELPDRESVFSESSVGELAGVPMALAYDRLDMKSGFACWAWQETDGLPRLLVVELRFPPADCDSLYGLAGEGAEGLAVAGGEACYDGRALHLRAGQLYARISALGFPSELDALRQAADALAEAINTNQ